MATVARNAMLFSKFKGCYLGALLGDCLGAVFETVEPPVTVPQVTQFFTNLVNDQVQKKYSYTDDTAMTISVSDSLLESKKGFMAEHMARRFSESYFADPGRGYGRGVVKVFEDLRKESFSNPFGPASRQFDGKGSHGNGGCMRIAPAAMFSYHRSHEKLVELCDRITKITHSNVSAIHGAIHQAVAVHTALHCCPEHTFDSQAFLETILTAMRKVEAPRTSSPYSDKLMIMKEFLASKDVERKTVIEKLGNGIAALESAPTALFCFLRSFAPVQDIEKVSGSVFEGCIIDAVCMGGDTDTIATMAGAISGAYWGLPIIPATWLKVCEDEGVRRAEVDGERMGRLVVTGENGTKDGDF